MLLLLGVLALLPPTAAAPPPFTVAAVAGTGTSGGPSPDGTAGTAASFSRPPFVFVFDDTTLLADTISIRTLPPSGLLGTLAGAPHAGACTAPGDGGAALSACIEAPAAAAVSPAALNQLVFADSTYNRVRAIRDFDRNKIWKRDEEPASNEIEITVEPGGELTLPVFVLVRPVPAETKP